MMGIKSIDLDELQQWKADSKSFQLVDVREDSERAHFNIGGEWIPLGEIVNQKGKIFNKSSFEDKLLKYIFTFLNSEYK